MPDQPLRASSSSDHYRSQNLSSSSPELQRAHREYEEELDGKTRAPLFTISQRQHQAHIYVRHLAHIASNMNGESNQGAKKHKANGGNGSSASPEVLMKMMMNMQQEMNAMKHKMLEMEVKLSNYDELEKECHSLRRQLNASVAMSAQQTAMSAMLFNALQEQSTVNRRLTQYAEELNTKMESLERSSKAQFLFHRQLIDNQSWEYSAPIPEVDSPFWVDEGYEEEDVQKFVLVLSR